VYAITHQPLGILQGLVAAKSSIAKKGVTIPRLQPLAGQMATNLVHNVKGALQGFPLLDGQHRCSPMDQVAENTNSLSAIE